jgi:hypothetical protein
MSQYQIFTAQFHRFFEPAIVITSAYKNDAGYQCAEYYLLISDDAKTFLGGKLHFNAKSFEASPVQLDDKFVFQEALGQANMELLLYMQTRVDTGNLLLQSSPIIAESSVSLLAQAAIRQTFPQLEDVCKKTNCDPLRDTLELLLRLPKLSKQKL